MAFSTLEKIFIREEMYIDFKYEQRSLVYKYMYDRFPFSKSFVRDILSTKICSLTQINDSYYTFRLG
jgi:topoisomerase-4 subunit A